MVLKNLLQAALHMRRKKSAAHPSIYRLLLPTCMTLMLTVTCFMTASWGWFTANESCGVSAITTGEFNGTSASVTTTTVMRYSIVSAPAEEATDDAGVMTTSLLHFDPLSSDDTADPVSDTESDVPVESTSETGPTYKTEKIFDTTDLTLNEENEWVFHATENQNHHFLVNTAGTAKGFVQVVIEEEPVAEGTENRTLYGYMDGDGTVEFNLLLEVPCKVTISTSWGSPADPGDDIIPTDYSLAQETAEESDRLFALHNRLLALRKSVWEVPTYGNGTQEVIDGGDIIVEPVQPEVSEETPAVDETPAVGETPAVDETPTVGETPAVDETPAVGETPTVDETPAVGETPTVDETPVIGETPTVGETPAAEETPAVDETPAAEEKPAVEETPAAEETTAASPAPEPSATESLQSEGEEQPVAE